MAKQNDANNTTTDAQLLQMAIDHLCNRINVSFPQYPQFGSKFYTICEEESYDDLNVLLEDISDGFDESVILEAISEEIDIKDEHKEPLCWFIHFILTNYSPPPTSLNLADISIQTTSKEVHEMQNIVEQEAIYFKPECAQDEITLKLLIIGRKHRFPLVTFLLDLYARCRLLIYQNWIEKLNDEETLYRKHKFKCKNAFEDLSIPKFIERVLKSKSKETCSQTALVWFETTMESVYRQLSLSPLHLVHRTWTINDSRFIFAKYYIAMLIAVDNILKNTVRRFPLQIDFWVIPKRTRVCENDSDDDKDSSDDDMEYSESEDWCDDDDLLSQLHSRLLKLDNLITKEITDRNVDVLCQLLFDVCQSVIKGEYSKRMVVIIDRRGSDGKDRLYAYLPTNTHNIPSGNYLHEAMMHLSRLEVIPSEDGNVYPAQTKNVVNVAAPIYSMCLLSIQVHSTDVIRAYWYVHGTYTRWYLNDIINIWPAYFGEDLDEDVNNKIINLIKDKSALVPLQDAHFDAFFEINAGIKASNAYGRPCGETIRDCGIRLSSLWPERKYHNNYQLQKYPASRDLPGLELSVEESGVHDDLVWFEHEPDDMADNQEVISSRKYNLLLDDSLDHDNPQFEYYDVARARYLNDLDILASAQPQHLPLPETIEKKKTFHIGISVRYGQIKVTAGKK
eukprot:399112_1